MAATLPGFGVAADAVRKCRTDSTRPLSTKNSDTGAVPFHAIYESLSGGLTAKGKAALTLALSFHTWRTLTRDAKLKPKDAVALMVRTVLTS